MVEFQWKRNLMESLILHTEDESRNGSRKRQGVVAILMWDAVFPFLQFVFKISQLKFIVHGHL